MHTRVSGGFQAASCFQAPPKRLLRDTHVVLKEVDEEFEARDAAQAHAGPYHADSGLVRGLHTHTHADTGAWHAAPQVSVFVLLYCTSKASKVHTQVGKEGVEVEVLGQRVGTTFVLVKPVTCSHPR